MSNISAKERRLRLVAEDPVFRKIIRIEQEFSGRIYLVGGALRDVFLNQRPQEKREWDFAVGGDSLALARLTADALGGVFVLLDVQTATARVVLRYGRTRYELDFCRLRASSLRADLKKRDFTINTLAIEVKALGEGSLKVTDFFGAREDIRRKRVRAVSRSAFKDDPLRILRGEAFCARFKFSFDSQTEQLIQRDAGLLKRVAPERVTEELAKVFSVPRAYPYVAHMDRLGVVKVLFPETVVLRGFQQGGFHHLPVWEHSLETLKCLEGLIPGVRRKMSLARAAKLEAYLQESLAFRRSRLWILKLSCLLHDIGKPLCQSRDENGHYHFYSHEKAGAEISATIGKRLRLSQKETETLKKMVFYHLRPGQLVNQPPSRRARFRFIRQTGENAPALMLLALADRKAMQGPLSRSRNFIFRQDDLISLLSGYFSLGKKKTRPLLTGNELMRLLGVPPGPEIGWLLREIEEARALRRVKDRSQAEQLARRLHLRKTSEASV